MAQCHTVTVLGHFLSYYKSTALKKKATVKTRLTCLKSRAYYYIVIILNIVTNEFIIYYLTESEQWRREWFQTQFRSPAMLALLESYVSYMPSITISMLDMSPWSPPSCETILTQRYKPWHNDNFLVQSHDTHWCKKHFPCRQWKGKSSGYENSECICLSFKRSRIECFYSVSMHPSATFTGLNGCHALIW